MNRVSGLSEAQHQAGGSSRVICIVLEKLAICKGAAEVCHRYAVSLPFVLGMAGQLEVSRPRHGLNPGYVHTSGLVHEGPSSRVYIRSGALTPMRPRVRARARRQAATSFSRAFDRGMSSETTRHFS